MARIDTQASLFETKQRFPEGFVYRPNFLTVEEEAELLGYIEDLPLVHGSLGEYTAKRRLINFGWGYDFKNRKIIPGSPLPPFLRPLQRKVAKWLHIPASHVGEALITEYTEGAAIGWHVDSEPCEHIVGISLAGWSLMRLRPVHPSGYSDASRSRLRGSPRMKRDIATHALGPRSAYILQGDSRWFYQHSIPPVEELRYSITFRTLLRPSTKYRAHA